MNEKVRVGDRWIGVGERAFIIAEAGSNHDRKLRQAKQLIDVAVEAGADAVKFQLFSADRIAALTKDRIAELRDQVGQYGHNLHELYRNLELPGEWVAELAEYGRLQGILFFVTPFDEDAVDRLVQLGVPAFKIASFEMVHVPLLRHVARTGKPLIISTGMGDLGDIEVALDAVYAEGNRDVVLLHCGINYPAPFEEVNLAAMDTMRQAFKVPVGYSDHTSGLTVPIAAVARGANVIEKHFTLDRNLPGPDHSFALTPDELKQMVKAIRDAEAAIGSPIKRMAPSEVVHFRRGRRSLFAAVDIPAGTRITADMIAVLRPGIGLAPKLLDIVVGRRARQPIEAHQPITWDLI